MQKIPLILITALIPLLLKQLDSLIALAAKIASKAAAMASNKKIKCNDPRVRDIKKDLQNLTKQIAAINKALKSLTKILSALKKIGRVAKILKLVATIIPTTVPGPVSVVVTKVSDVGINCLSAVDSLSNLVGYIQIELQKISAIVANALNIVGGICNNEYVETDKNTKRQLNSLSNLNLGNNVKLSSANLNLTGTNISGDGFGNGLGGDGLGNGLGDGLGNGLGGDGLGNGLGVDGLGNGLGGDGIGNINYNDSRFKQDSYGIYINDGNSNRTYVSKFYNETNVSDSDIINALNILNDLYEQQKVEIGKILSSQDALTFKDKILYTQLNKKNIGTAEERALWLYREFPSNVYFGTSIIGEDTKLYPSLDGLAGIFSGGKPDDFFIDIEGKLIYGPKESNTEWGQPIKY